MDFFLLLPPELLLLVLRCLTLEELFVCLQVCRQWRERVSSFDSFWRRRCLQYDLPDYYIQEEEEERETTPVELLRLAYRQRRCINRLSMIRNQSSGDLSICNVPGLEKEEGVQSYGCQGAGSGVVVEMLCREVMVKSNQSFFIRKSNGEEKNVMFKGVGIHIFDQSRGCFKPVTIVTPSVQLVEPVLIFSRAAMDQSWVMIAFILAYDIEPNTGLFYKEVSHHTTRTLHMYM